MVLRRFVLSKVLHAARVQRVLAGERASHVLAQLVDALLTRPQAPAAPQPPPNVQRRPASTQVVD